MLPLLMHRFEVASQKYADENGIRRDPDWFMLKLHEEVGEVTQAWNRLTGRGRSRGRSEKELKRNLADETADLLGHVLLLAYRNGLDIEGAIERKWRFRPSET